MVRVGAYRRPVYATHCLTGDVPEEALIAPRYRHDPYAGHFLYGVDTMLGDDEYVFLSVEQFYETSADCYLFNAEELVRKGALVRKFDISAYPGLESDWLWLSDFGESEEDLKDAAARGTEGIWESFEKLKAARDKITLRGDEAIEFLRHPERWSPKLGMPEILVPKRLPLYRSIGVYPIG